jgi:hypothetical protein
MAMTVDQHALGVTMKTEPLRGRAHSFGLTPGGHARELAAREALRHAGPTILLSGCTVAIGFSWALGTYVRSASACGQEGAV